MTNFFDDSSFTMTESENERDRVIHDFEKNESSSSIISTYDKYTDWWNKTKQVFDSCSSIARDSGQASLKTLSSDGGDFKQYYDLFLSNPSSLKSFGIWAMYQAIQNAELKFIEQCKTPRTELSLTGKLTANIDHSASKVQEKYEQHLCLSDTYINLSEVELQVQNREKDTGADFALILEWKDDKGIMQMCPIYFQAKRVISELGDISQHNEGVGYQFNVLKARKTNAAYIFYNCNTQKVNESPRPASVKNVKDISVSDVPKNTSAVENVLTLSSFLLEVMVNPVKFKVFNNRASALSSILESIQENELASVFSLSVDPDARAKYEQAYQKYVAFKQKQKQKQKKRLDKESGSSYESKI